MHTCSLIFDFKGLDALVPQSHSWDPRLKRPFIDNVSWAPSLQGGCLQQLCCGQLSSQSLPGVEEPCLLPWNSELFPAASGRKSRGRSSCVEARLGNLRAADPSVCLPPGPSSPSLLLPAATPPTPHTRGISSRNESGARLCVLFSSGGKGPPHQLVQVQVVHIKCLVQRLLNRAFSRNGSCAFYLFLKTNEVQISGLLKVFYLKLGPSLSFIFPPSI